MSNVDRHRPCCLVTGALGFVGRHLCRSLLLAGHPVVGVGKPEAGGPPAAVGSFTRVGEAAAVPGAWTYRADAGDLHYLPLDLGDAAGIRDLVDRLDIASVYHLAAQSSAAVSFRQPGATFAANVTGTLNLLEALRGIDPAKRPVTVAVGSCEEYGAHPAAALPLTEDAPLDPLSPYGVSKVAQTLLCRQYARAHDLPVVITRSFSHTGPGHDARFAFPAFARQIAAAEAGRGPAEILTGNLDAVRDFLDVRDVIGAYRLLAKEGRPGEIYNVCAGRGLTIRDGLEILVGAARVPVTHRQDPARSRPADIPAIVGDNAKLRRETGWEPEWDFTTTLHGLLDEARREFA